MKEGVNRSHEKELPVSSRETADHPIVAQFEHKIFVADKLRNSA